ncbi:hypothetical protein INS43_03710 [Corynebacterium aurimucosum]|uniref:hypothetical protein n=1 Tax=Corynebacterium aurimucosum TaxID=169292 RepID=UPI0018798716|nr:hypothetical protein [Corynebacterium aurimucosum]MBE7340107.1 hypothetical protein [Corynebacterium aurimucosum]MBE7364291.1 hypothetical protein [Corynebacterium aurimucosum]
MRENGAVGPNFAADGDTSVNDSKQTEYAHGRRGFLELHWEGERFKDAQFPVAVVRELAVVENAIRSLAREIWRNKNKRQRVPKGFKDQFRLYLDDVTNGCVNTVLVAGPAPTDTPALFENAEVKVFDYALDFFLKILTGDASTEDVAEFKSLDDALTFGKSLEPGEQVEIWNRAGSSTDKVTYSKEKRTRIRAKYGARDEEVDDTQLVWVSSLDESGLINFTTYRGEQLRLSEESDPNTWEKSRQWLRQTREARLLQVEGRFLVANDGRLKKVTQVDSIKEAFPSEWQDRVATLMKLEPGWLGDDQGDQISLKSKRVVEALLSKFFENEIIIGDTVTIFEDEETKVDRPAIYPLMRGGFQLEWEADSIDWSIEVPNTGNVEINAFGDGVDKDSAVSPDSDDLKTAGEVFEALVSLMRKIEEDANG